MKKTFLVVAAVWLSTMVSGCMWGRMLINDPSIAERAKAIVPGVTRGDQVAEIIGAQPTLRMPGKQQILFGYTYGDTKNNGLMLILFNFTRSTTVTDTLYIAIDAESGIVTNVYLPKHHDIEWRFWPFGED